ncbi:hypothetical protein [Paenibacillus pabuli]|uniref:hypothetical protein n=1 Tax=Paenibacillus pabuli TaxID=1472 RepID=UPI001FFFC68E|nr:hypothetical protein [Paenibacillus pabuli]UPK45909.1 hypothetical protein KET34_10845 [Paenibacillus pabuli]
MIFVILLVIIVGCVFMYRFTSKLQKQKQEQMSERGAITFISANHVEGLPVSSNAPCDIIQFEDQIRIESGTNKFQIPLENMRAAVTKTERELIEKSKSVVGRAVIGTLLVPGLGTIVGGMSGIGKKQSKGAANTYIILNYINAQGDLSAATFLNNTNMAKVHKFCQDINNAIQVHTGQEAIQL